MHRVFILGYGRMGKARAEIAKSLGYEIAGIYDPNIPEYSVSPFSKMHQDDFLFICALPDVNEMAAKSFYGRANIFVEKPYYAYYDERVWVGWSHRYHPQIEEIRSLTPDKDELSFLSLTWIRNKGIPGGWFASNANVWGDIGVHLMDMATFICKAPFSEFRMLPFDFSKGDETYKASWWGGDEWQYHAYDNAIAMFMCGNTVCLVRVAWASPEQDTNIEVSLYYRDKNLRYSIDPMKDDIFQKETEDFLTHYYRKQETYV